MVNESSSVFGEGNKLKMILILIRDLHFSRSTISREKFEELCGDLWEQSLIPLKEVLERSNLTIDEIYAVELIGGATRVPKLQVVCLISLAYIYMTQKLLSRVNNKMQKLFFML